MSKHKPSLKSTLQKKVPLESTQKNIEAINSEIKSIHSKSNDEVVLTTIHLPKSIHTKVKIHCAEHNISIKDFIAEVICNNL